MKISELGKDNVLVLNNPIIKHNLAVLRNKDSTTESFRKALKRIGLLLASDTFSNLPVEKIKVETPLEITEAHVIDNSYKIIIVPILRAALALSQVFEEMLPLATVYHLGLFRNEDTLEPNLYYNKIPGTFKDPSKVIVYILDPMLATGGSAVSAIEVFIKKGIPEQNISFISVISAPEGVAKIRSQFNNIRILTAALDRELNSKGYILPGLGDAGDRVFNTY